MKPVLPLVKKGLSNLKLRGQILVRKVKGVLGIKK